MRKFSPILRLALKIAVTIFLFWLVLRKVGIHSVLELFVGSNLPGLILATGVLFLLLFPATIRWHYVLQSLRLSFPFGLKLQWNLAAGFFNNFLPTGIGGDILRAEWCRQTGLPIGPSFESVVVDRLATFLCLLITIALSLPFAAPMIDIPGPELLAWSGIAVGGLIAGLALLYILNRVNFLGAGYILKMLKHAICGIKNPETGPMIIVSGVATHTLRVIGVWLIAKALHIDISLTVCLLLIPLALLLAMIPVTVGGWGLREGVFVVVLSQVQVSAVEAITLSVVFGLASLVSSLPGAVAWIFLKNPKINNRPHL
jgi:uncharacterized membrane protein YbhN (UPF0104 family)